MLSRYDVEDAKRDADIATRRVTLARETAARLQAAGLSPEHAALAESLKGQTERERHLAIATEVLYSGLTEAEGELILTHATALAELADAEREHRTAKSYYLGLQDGLLVS
jgi:hypothetical protein